MDRLRDKAYKLGAIKFGVSWLQKKRFYVVLPSLQIIHFGSRTGTTFIDHANATKRRNWWARHSAIKNKNGEFVINLKTSPSFWSAHILW